MPPACIIAGRLIMKRVFLLLAVTCILASLAGCGDGVAVTRSERQERHRRILDADLRQLNDDWDVLWLNDRPSRLTEWKVE